MQKQFVLLHNDAPSAQLKQLIIEDVGLKDSFLFQEIDKLHPSPTVLKANISDCNVDVTDLAHLIAFTQKKRSAFVIASFELDCSQLPDSSKRVEKFFSGLVFALHLREVRLEEIALSFKLRGIASHNVDFEFMSFVFYRTLMRCLPPAIPHILLDCEDFFTAGTLIQTTLHLDFEKPWRVSLFLNMEDSPCLENGKASLVKSLRDCFKGEYKDSSGEEGDPVAEEKVIVGDV